LRRLIWSEVQKQSFSSFVTFGIPVTGVSPIYSEPLCLMAKFAGAVGYPPACALHADRSRVSRKGKVFPTCEPRKGHCGSSERRDKGVHLNNARLVTKSWYSENTSPETRETPASF
ncbi:MAG: hypothetical protein ABID54_05800, partial [Pseudomonadota bacterium]